MDIDVLISSVYNRRALWDKKHKRHGNRPLTCKYWTEISTDMKEDENKLRRKWRYLRDQFAVELGKIHYNWMEVEENVNVKWPYFQSLLFLKDQVRPRIPKWTPLQRSNSPEQNSIDPEFDRADPLEASNDFGETSPPSSNYKAEINHIPLRRPKSKIYVNRRLEIEQRKLLYHQKKRLQHNRLDSDNDEHILFFKSLLPHIRRIPSQVLLSFRSRIQDVVEEYAYQNKDIGCSNSLSNLSDLSAPLHISETKTIRS